jgi:hypothetical protein
MPMAACFFLIQTVLVTAIVRLGLWLLPFRNVQQIVNSLAYSANQPKPCPSIAQLANTVTAASRYVPAASCLTQALTMQILLGRCGHVSTLRIGVARSQDGKFQAHAWVELEGRIVIGGTAEDLAQHYRAFPAIEAD